MYKIQRNSNLNIIILLLSFFIIFSYSFPLTYDHHPNNQLIFNNTRILCGFANISFSSQIPPSNPPVPFYGHFSSCETSHGSTIINGRFYNLPNNDTNPKNYYLYLLYPDNKMRRDLSWIFTKGLKIKRDSGGIVREAILSLTFRKKSDFPLRGASSYVGGWVKVYHIQNSVITSAGPARIH
ncbi:hypothetical protein Glove_94g38 [Diversispora epigaea]|uniref:Uncharacterized protein n=1 Tax=Diversispora epigaea TaxID=1348612 RepID=A0A397J536_9GLOM|nr:hypothetical protein Glove_94g38 [Diversispora epigaea]